MGRQDYVDKEPRATYLGNAALAQLGTNVSFTHTLDTYGGVCSLDMAENVPDKYFFTGDKESRLTGYFQRDRCCWPCVTQWCPGWIPFCPQQTWTEVYDKQGKNKWEVYVRRQKGHNLLCCPELCGIAPVMEVIDNDKKVFDTTRANFCGRLCGPCYLFCCGTVTTESITTMGEETFTTRVVPDSCYSGHCLADFLRTCGVVACLSPARCTSISECSVCLKEVNVPMSHSVPIYGPSGTADEPIAKIHFEGAWEGQHCCCFNCCFNLYDKYTVNVTLPSGTKVRHLLGSKFNEVDSEALIAYAMWYDYEWVLPHVDVPCGPVPTWCPVSTACHCC